MRVERPLYRLFCYGYPNSSSDDGHLGWLFSLGIPWLRIWRRGDWWIAQKCLFTAYLHHEGLTIAFLPLRWQFAILHRGGCCARGKRLLFKFESYGLYFDKLIKP